MYIILLCNVYYYRLFTEMSPNDLESLTKYRDAVISSLESNVAMSDVLQVSVVSV